MRQFLLRTNDRETLEKISEYIQFLNEKHSKKDATYQVIIKLNRPVRSHNANAYYFYILKSIAVASGHWDTDQLHSFFKKKFNSTWVLDEQIGESTKDLDTAEFSAYVKKVKAFAREFFGIDFPEEGDEKYKMWMDQVDTDYDNITSSV